MLDPLFDKKLAVVAWIDPGRYIFDLDLNWVAYISNGNVWNSVSNDWLGIVDGRTCIDKNGFIVAWSPKDPVRTWPRRLQRPLHPPLTPLTPLTPFPPLTPLIPLKPVGNYLWSDLTFSEWISGKA